MNRVFVAALALGVAVLVVTTQAAPAAATTNDFLITVPESVIAAAVAAAGPDVLKEVQALPLPTTCCYDKDSVNIDFENVAVTASGCSASVSATTAAAGVSVAWDVTLATAYFYRLCLHDDPFGHGCSTLYGCKGDATTSVSAPGSVGIAVGFSSTGALTLTPATPSLSLSIPSSTLCSKIEGEISKELPSLETTAEGLIDTGISTAIASVLAKFPQSLPINDDIGVFWALGTGTATSADGLVLTGSANVEAVQLGNKVGPFEPRFPLPAPAFNGSAVSVVIADSVLSNAGWAFWETGLLSFDHEVTILSKNVSLSVNVTAAPQFFFEARTSDDTIYVIASGVASATGSNSTLFVAEWTVTVAGNITFVNGATPELLVQVDPDDASLNITAVKGSFSSTFLHLIVSDALKDSILPDANKVLEAHPLPVPAYAGITIKDPVASFGNGYMEITGSVGATDTGAGGAWTLDRKVWAALGAAIACPNIPDFHSAGCI